MKKRVSIFDVEAHYVCRGRIRARGKKANPLFCYRERSEGSGDSKRVYLEIHSNVTGRKIGYYSGRKTGFSPDRAGAREEDYLNGPHLPLDFSWFISDAKQKARTRYNEGAKAGLAAMTKAARKV